MNANDILRILIDISTKLFEFPEINIGLFEGHDLTSLENIEDAEYFLDKTPPFRFDPINENHRGEYSQLSECEKPNYVSMSYKIVYPNDTIENVIEYTKNVRYRDDSTCLYCKIVSFVNYALGYREKEKLSNYIILYAFLHEIGHYESLANKNYMPYEMLNNINDEEIKADEFAIWWLGKLKHDNFINRFL